VKTEAAYEVIDDRTGQPGRPLPGVVHLSVRAGCVVLTAPYRVLCFDSDTIEDDAEKELVTITTDQGPIHLVYLRRSNYFERVAPFATGYLDPDDPTLSADDAFNAYFAGACQAFA
jgi:hypothetical protein